MHNLDKSVEFAGRALLAAIFLIAGLGKIGQYAGTAAYMESAGVPGVLLPLVIGLEMGGALAILVGWRTRIAALLLGAFTLTAALWFHNDFQEPMQQILFLKNIAIAGGLLLLVRHGAGPWSLDARRG